MQDQKVKLEDIVSLIEQDRVALIAKLNDDSDFKRAWRHNISGYFYKGIWEKLDIAKDDNGVQTNKPMNEMSRWYGNVGGGKSVASLFVVYLEREFFGFDYATLFSQMEASMWLVDKTYEANIEGKELVRCTLNIDEDRRMFGAGSVQEENFFDEFTEFLRQRQINIHVLNPNDIHSVDVQFEVIGYTNENYCKSIMYQKIDKRSGRYKPIGYVLTRQPPKNYIDAYDLQKKNFLDNFMANRSGRNFKDSKTLEYSWKAMTYQNKELLRSLILLGKERDVKTIIKREIKGWNLPVKLTDELVETFKWKYYTPEITKVYARQTAMMEMKAMKAGLYKKEVEEAPEIEAEPITESVKKTSSIAIKHKGIDVRELMG